MDVITELRLGILTLLGLAAFLVELAAFIDALRHRPDAYVAAGKLTKVGWTVILGVATLLGFVVMNRPLTLFGLLAFVAGAVYWLDVRPALKRVLGNRNSGPYGRW